MSRIEDILNKKLPLKNLRFVVQRGILFLDFGTDSFSLVAHSGSLDMMDHPEFEWVKAANIGSYHDKNKDSPYFGKSYRNIENSLSCLGRQDYFERNRDLAGGPIPRGEWGVSTTFNNASPAGYEIRMPLVLLRNNFRIHLGHSTPACMVVASQGCITIPGTANWDVFKRAMGITNVKGVDYVHISVV